jgi:hypothetical protein
MYLDFIDEIKLYTRLYVKKTKHTNYRKQEKVL